MERIMRCPACGRKVRASRWLTENDQVEWSLTTHTEDADESGADDRFCWGGTLLHSDVAAIVAMRAEDGGRLMERAHP